MLDFRTPFILLGLNSGGENIVIDYLIDGPDNYLNLSASFNVYSSGISSQKITDLNVAVRRLTPHFLMLAGMVPEPVYLKHIESLGYKIPSADFRKLELEELGTNIISSFTDYQNIEFGTVFQSLSMGSAQGDLKMSFKVPCGNKYFGVGLPAINISDPLPTKKLVAFPYFEAILSDLREIEKICFSFIQSSSKTQSRQLSLFEKDKYTPNIPEQVEDNGSQSEAA